MSFHMIAFTQATGGAVTDSDMTAATDPEISQRNSHYIFTESYRLGAAAVFGATCTRQNVSVPSWNQLSKFNIWPINRSITVPSPPQIDSWLPYPPPIPQNEEFAVKNTDTASEQVTTFFWLMPDNWNQNLPRGLPPTPIFECRVNFTASSITANQWSGLQPITFEQLPRGGTYAIVGTQCQGTNLLAGRWVFSRAPIYNNRKLRPGFLCTNAVGDLEVYNLPMGPMTWGEYGRFSTFELPQVEFWINTTGTPAIEMRVWLVWLSQDMNVVY